MEASPTVDCTVRPSVRGAARTYCVRQPLEVEGDSPGEPLRFTFAQNEG